MIPLYRIEISLTDNGDIQCKALYGARFSALPKSIQEEFKAAFAKVDVALFNAMKEISKPNAAIEAFVNPNDYEGPLMQALTDAKAEMQTIPTVKEQGH